MSSTGYSHTRAVDHDAVVELVVSALLQNGYRPRLADVDGDEPDIEIVDMNGKKAFVDVKTRYSNHHNWAVKHGSLVAYWLLTIAGTPVYVVWETNRSVLVDTVFTLSSRIVGGPRRATGNGSRTDWLMVRPGGEPFEKFFVRKGLVTT